MATGIALLLSFLFLGVIALAPEVILILAGEPYYEQAKRTIQSLPTVNSDYLAQAALDKMNKDYLENTSDAQKVIDYISGMTDNYLEREYEKYK